MAGLSAEQRNDYYLREATRTGIHKPILAALFAAQQRPSLSDGETGLGISPANRIPLEQVSTFAQQVQYAANTIRSITHKLIDQGWESQALWNAEQGRYADRFLEVIANGYVPSMNEADAARLEPTNEVNLQQAYEEDWTIDCKAATLPPTFTGLDAALIQFVTEIPRYYIGVSYQRQALLEANRLWRQLDTRKAVKAALLELPETDPTLPTIEESRLDQPLLQALQQFPGSYSGYPHQREALLRLVQLWGQHASREIAIANLATSPNMGLNMSTDIRMVDPALVVFVQRLAQSYQGKGDQRNALTETYRLWYGLDSRGTVLQTLGIDAQTLSSSNPNRNALLSVANQLDRTLLEFAKQIPALYAETESQREALLRLVQLWQGFEGREQTLRSLLDEVQHLEYARRDSIDAAPKPEPIALPPRPAHWTPTNLQLYAAIFSNGSLTWADATQGGTHLPTHQATVDAIVRMAELAQQVCDRLSRPLSITRWYAPAEAKQTPQQWGPNRHPIGDAIEFYCDGLSGDQIYRAIDPWWTGGLGRYRQFPYLCYIDGRDDRVRWTQT